MKLTKRESAFAEALGIKTEELKNWSYRSLIGLFGRGNVIPSNAEIVKSVKILLKRNNQYITDKYYIAAILGADYKDPNFKKLLKEHFNNFKYGGLFGDKFDRWYWIPLSDALDEWIKQYNKRYKRSYMNYTDFSSEAGPKERTEFIYNFTGIRLKPAKPLPFSKSKTFDNVCYFTKRPIDMIESFKLCENEIISPYANSIFNAPYISFYWLVQNREKAVNVLSSEDYEQFLIQEEFFLKGKK